MVKEVFKIIDFSIMLYMLYYMVTGVFAFIKRRQVKKYEIKNKFAVLIAARDEAKVIGNLLESLNRQNYPKEFYDVYVIPNNCTDNTKEISLSKNANIIECNYQVKSKGEALQYAFNELKESDYKAYLIFDADNIVHPDFIKEMNSCLNNGYGVAQGFRDSKNPGDSWISCSYSLHYMIQNTFVNLSRMNIRQSSFINGTGFMISKAIIEKYGYEAHTMTEDIEFTVKSSINNCKIAFVEDAITYDEQAVNMGASFKQRKRWSIGTIQCLGLYGKSILKTIITKRRFVCLDSLVFLLAPFLQLASAAVFIAHIIACIVSDSYTWMINQVGSLAFMYLMSVALSVMVIKVNNKKIKTYIKGIFTLPIFMLTWIPINIAALLNQNSKWEKIEHNRNVDIEKMLKINC